MRREDKRQEIVRKSRSFKKKVRREKENRWGWR